MNHSLSRTTMDSRASSRNSSLENSGVIQNRRTILQSPSWESQSMVNIMALMIEAEKLRKIRTIIDDESRYQERDYLEVQQNEKIKDLWACFKNNEQGIAKEKILRIKQSNKIRADLQKLKKLKKAETEEYFLERRQADLNKMSLQLEIQEFKLAKILEEIREKKKLAEFEKQRQEKRQEKLLQIRQQLQMHARFLDRVL